MKTRQLTDERDASSRPSIETDAPLRQRLWLYKVTPGYFETVPNQVRNVQNGPPV